MRSRLVADCWFLAACAGIVVVGFVLLSMSQGVDFVTSVKVVGLVSLVLGVLTGLVRIAYLPIQYFRHRSALRLLRDRVPELLDWKERAMELSASRAEFERGASADVFLRSTWRSWRQRDPLTTPWWRW